MLFPLKKLPVEKQGFALILVLCFIALLSILVLACFSNAALQRTIADSSANQTKVNLFALGAVDTIVGDLKQEIAAGSRVTPVYTNSSTGVTNYIYLPFTNFAAVPAISGFKTNIGLENLVKISSGKSTLFAPVNTTIYPYLSTYPVSNRATTNYSTVPSLNGRYISPARWNKSLLIARTSIPSGPTDTTPTLKFSQGNVAVPTWILVDRSGNNPDAVTVNATVTTNMQWSSSPTNTNTVIGRYAYAIYNEGGLLDANVAGYPVTNNSSTNLNTNIPYKNAEPFADLTQLTNASGRLLSDSNITALLNWRNAASTRTGSGGVDTTGSNYVNYVLSNFTGFLHPSSTNLTSTGQSDSMFASRQQLIDFFYKELNTRTTPSPIDALPYLSTFTRGLDQPSYAPPTNRPKVLTPANGGTLANGNDDLINPSFLKVRVATSFTRNDGTTAVVGEPLVKKRFALNRLTWLTYNGPSASRTIPSSNPGTSSPDYDMWLLVNKYGIPASYLAQGTAQNIKKYFGLTWNNGAWTYDNNGSGTGGAIMRLGDLTTLSTPREPDFFELLKATISVGSFGKALVNSTTAISTAPAGAIGLGEVPENWQYSRDASVDGQIIQIGANIINQSRCDGYPVRINFNDGSLGNREFAGVANLPYLCNVINGVLQVTQPTTLPDLYQNPVATSNSTNGTLSDPGLGVVMQFPILWNPHDINCPIPASGISPKWFRAVVDTTTPDNATNSDNGNSSYWQLWTYAASGNQSISISGSPPTTTVNSTFSFASPSYSYAADSSSPSSTGGQSFVYRGSSDGGGMKQMLNANNSALNFQITANGLFREPTLLFRPNYPAGSNLQIPSSHRIRSEAPVSGLYTGGGLPTSVADPCGFNQVGASTAAAAYPLNTPFLGFYLGAYPLRWIQKDGGGTPYTLSSSGKGVVLARYRAGVANGYTGPIYFTYRLQWSTSSSGPWYTYDTKYGKYSSGRKGSPFAQDSLVAFIGKPTLFSGYGFFANSTAAYAGNSGYWCTAIDPRTGRFGLITSAHANHIWGGHGVYYTFEGQSGGFNPVVNYALNSAEFGSFGWLDYINGVTTTLRTEADAGAYSDGWNDFTNVMTGWNATSHYVDWQNQDQGFFTPIGMLAQNNADCWSSSAVWYSDNSNKSQASPFYYADPDGVVRRAMGAYVPRATNNNLLSGSSSHLSSAATTVGIPTSRASAYVTARIGSQTLCGTINTNSVPSTANYTYQSQSRPYFLNRPYRTVAELGCVFRDTPWKNLDFFTPESADASLLDVFCISDSTPSSGLTAGKLDLNTRQQPVLAAILSGGCLDDSQVGLGLQTPAAISANALASNASSALVLRTYSSAVGLGPLSNLADLIGKFAGATAPITVSTAKYSGQNTGIPALTLAGGFCDGKLSYAGFSGGVWDTNNGAPSISSPATDLVSAVNSVYSPSASNNGIQETLNYVQRLHEGPIRALTAVGQTRVWNLLIDVVAQTGRYPHSATSLSNFIVEGEQRYWVHLAIDRLTGQVLDKQIEVVKE